MNEPVVIGNATLYLGDCLSILPTINGIDALITDPPYFLTDLKLDKESAAADWELMTHCVQTNGYLAAFAPEQIQHEISRHWKRRFSGIWMKQAPVKRTHAAKKPPGLFELYVVYAHKDHKISDLVWNQVIVPGEPYRTVRRKRAYRRGGHDSLDRSCTEGWTIDGFVHENSGFRYCPDVLLGNNKTGMRHSERTDHPTQKPIEVMEVLVQWLTNPGDVIFDPYMGSGTTGVAALKHDRRFIGCEINPDYFAMACERIENAQRQQQMEF
jgi:site-specific DNA-methyltransferase (adenine-specific)